MLPPHLRVIWYVFLLKLYFVITCRQKQTAIFSKLLKFDNIKHSPITYIRNELLSMRASASLRPYMINSINNCAIYIYRRKRRTHRGGRRRQHKINVVATPTYQTPTFIEKQHGSNLSNLHFPMSIDLQSANLRSNKRKCLPSFKIATFNCRTLKSDNRVLELIELVRKKCIDVLTIQEHRRTKTALRTNINIPTGYRLFMNDTHSPGVGGIGFVISPRCSYKLISSEFFSTRIGKLLFDISRRRIHILSIYAPTAIDAHTNETMFFTTLSSIVDAIPTHDHLFICGDLNATLPVDKVRVKNRCGEANRNTKMLQSFIERYDLLAANAYTRQKHRSLPTFDGPNWRKTRLDRIFCPLHYRCSLRKSNTIMTSVITSDHRFVTAGFSLKWPARKSRSKQIDWTSLITPDIRSAFVTDVRQEISSGSDFRLAVLQASVRHLPFKRHSRLQDDPRILNARKTVQGACI